MSTATPGHTGPVISGPHHDGPQCPDPGLSVSTPFAGLVAELGELGFEPSLRPVQPGHVVYAATDSPVTVTLLTEPGSSHVQVDSPAASQPWYVAWSDGTPLHVQLIALYAVLNNDPEAALEAAAASFGAAAPDEPARPYPAG